MRVDAREAGAPSPTELRRRAAAAIARTKRTWTALDLHTSGEPTRVLLGAVDGRTWPDASRAREEFRVEHDWLRRASTFEPRGHVGMFAATLVPVEAASGWGVVFASPDGYPDMCGHATIGVAVALVELGLVEARAGGAAFDLDTPGGTIAVRVDARTRAVTFRNRPAFLAGHATIEAPTGRTVEVPVAWGGQWYAFVDAAEFGLAITLDEIAGLVEAAGSVRTQLADTALEDPSGAASVQVGNVVWVEPGREGADARNVPVAPSGAFDRSPCGTGTCARLAVLHAEGRIARGDDFVNEGILGTRFNARVVDEVDAAGRPAVVPEVTGRAWLSGLLELSIEESDPLDAGFLPGSGHA